MPGTRCARSIRVLGVALFLIAGTGSSRAQETEACEAWPGEIDPLPTTSARDPLAKRWAELRASELRRLAAAVAGQRPGEARLLWSHARCLDPGTPGDDRLRPRVVVLNEPIWNSPPARVVASGPRVPPPVVDFESLDAALARAEEELGGARFRDVLDITRRLRSELQALDVSSAGVRERRARIEILAATSLVALGLAEEGAASLRRALRADPELVLDPGSTPPKVQRLWEEVRDRGEDP